MSDITPHMGTLLDGAITSNGPALHVHDNLHARGLVVDDGATRIAIVVCDSTMIDRTVMDRAKEIIKERCGLPNNRVLVSATHTHATPRTFRGLRIVLSTPNTSVFFPAHRRYRRAGDS